MNLLNKTGLSRSIIEVLADDPTGLRAAIARNFRAMAPNLHPDVNDDDKRVELFADMNGACQEIAKLSDEALLEAVKEFLGLGEQAVFERSFAAVTKQNEARSLERQIVELRHEIERAELRGKALLVEERLASRAWCALLTTMLPDRVWPPSAGISIRDLFDNIFLVEERIVTGRTKEAKKQGLVESIDYSILYISSEGQVWTDRGTLKFPPLLKPGVLTSPESQMRPADEIPSLLQQHARRALVEFRKGNYGSARWRGLALGFHPGSRREVGTRQQGVLIKSIEHAQDVLNEASQTIRLDDASLLVTVRPIGLLDQQTRLESVAVTSKVERVQRPDVQEFTIELLGINPNNLLNPISPS